MNWLFFVIFGPLMAASLYFCGADSSLRNWRSSFNADLDRDGQREFSRFLRSTEAIPAPSIAAAARHWAETVERGHRCVWDRITNWAWVLWITAGVVTAVAFGKPRDVAVHLIVFDLMLLVVILNQMSHRRARAVLAGAVR
ncbi:MAG: hypothetical protein M3450_11955 [Actinomycetota bacterium]|nr:hypothetical protein [Actinomycetota bacterium]